MNLANRLIVALDLPVDDAFVLVRRLRYQANNFKLGVGTFLSSGGFELARFLVHEGAGLMLDLKLYDTRDTVRRMMEPIANLGASMVTVHADCAAYATEYGPKVLAIFHLTDGTGRSGAIPIRVGQFDCVDGVVCPSWRARYLRASTRKLIVCPGIRPAGTESDNHIKPSAPGDAIRAGADFIVVGRPIYAAPDPVDAARGIVREIEAAISDRPLAGRLP